MMLIISYRTGVKFNKNYYPKLKSNFYPINYKLTQPIIKLDQL